MSDEHGGACCEECAMGRKCAGDSCGLAKARGSTVRGALRVPSGFQSNPVKAAGQVTLLPYSMPYPSNLLSDCNRWNAMSYSQKIIVAGNAVTPWRAAEVVAEIDRACGSPYKYSLFPFVYTYPWAFPTYATWWRDSSFNFHNPPVISASPATNQRATEAPPGAHEHPAGQGSVGQGFIGASLGMGSVGQGYIGRQLFPYQPYTFGSTPFPWNAATPAHLAPYNNVTVLPYWPLYGSFGNYYAPAGFAGTLTIEQRNRMLAVLTPTERAAYDRMTAAEKTVFENNYADAHWDVVSGTSTTPAQAAQTQAYLGATERALNLTFGEISTALANNNQQRLAEIRAAADARVAEINAQLQRDLAPTEATRLRYELDSVRYTQRLLDAEREKNQRNLLLIGAGVATIVVVGGVALYATRSRTNPVVGSGRNRHWEQPRSAKRRSSKSRRRTRARA